jgi:hypothetical protein
VIGDKYKNRLVFVSNHSQSTKEYSMLGYAGNACMWLAIGLAAGDAFHLAFVLGVIGTTFFVVSDGR